MVAALGDLFTLAAITVMMVLVDWRLALAAYLVVPALLWVSKVFRVRVRAAYRDIRTHLAAINAFLQERVTGMRVVQLFGRERDEVALRGARSGASRRAPEVDHGLMRSTSRRLRSSRPWRSRR